MGSEKGWLSRAVATGSISGLAAFLWSHVLLPWVVPLGTPIMIGIIAKTEGVSWTEIIVLALIGFAAVTHGLLRFDEWRERRRVEGKLALGKVNVARDIRTGGVIIGFFLHSSAGSPLEFEVTEVRTRLDNTVPNSSHVPKKHVIPTGGNAWHMDNAIQLPDSPRSTTLEGFIEFDIHYGPPDSSLKYRLSGKKQVVVKFNEDGLFTEYVWHDAV